MNTLTTRKPMKRTGFKRKEPAAIIKTATLGPSTFAADKYNADREQRLAERAARAMATASASPDNVVMTEPSLIYLIGPIEKDSPLRSEPYRRLVAALPCAHCGIEGYSQHAHENDGKGKGMKVDDRRAMPLCCTRPGIEGCHAAFDSYRLLPGGRDAHHAQGRAWAQQTRTRIYESGQWPKKVPLWQEGGSDAV